MKSLLLSSLLLGAALSATASASPSEILEEAFRSPPSSVRPHVMWMWMGSNITFDGITHDLEKLKDAGFAGTLMFSIADTTTPWPRAIDGAPTPEVIAFTAPWWERVRHAAAESKRLGLEFGMGNCPGYSTSGGPWVTPEQAMQTVVWSELRVGGGQRFQGVVPRPEPDLRGIQVFPVWNPTNGLLERPEHPARRSHYRDVALVAMPAQGVVALDQIVDLSTRLQPDGKLDWEAPPGDWVLYRFGHTIQGAILQPPQFEANGFECDKLSREAVLAHVGHVISETKRHLGDLIGSGFLFLHFDSYEAGVPRWTPRMRDEFRARRGYDPVPFLATLVKRVIESPERTKAYAADMNRTVEELFRENYYPVLRKALNEAGIRFSCEPYGGPWRASEVVPHVEAVMTEFWTNNGYHPSRNQRETIRAAIDAGKNVIQAEAFTGSPAFSQWSETPAQLKSLGDQAFCDGINRLVLHRFVHQPWMSRHKPGVAMGQWGTHFDHTQTWWEPGKAWISYLSRCQALLQAGTPVVATGTQATFSISGGQPSPRSFRRKVGETDVFFVANVARNPGSALARFPVVGKQPELWNPITGETRVLPEFTAVDGAVLTPLEFADSESFFIVFRGPLPPTTTAERGFNFALPRTAQPLDKVVWKVAFDPAWGGPKESTFPALSDWKDHADPAIRYFSGTATYRTRFNLSAELAARPLRLDLGTVRDIATIKVNGKDLGVLWTAPWSVSLSGVAKAGANDLEIAVTNTWVNRLVGDEQQVPDCEWRPGDRGFGGPLARYPDWVLKGEARPSKGRYTFTTWNYFTAKSPLQSSGLLGPVVVQSTDVP